MPTAGDKQLSLFKTTLPSTDTPYLIEPTKHGTFILNVGAWKKGEYGGNVRWTYVGEYVTLSKCIEASEARRK